MATLSATNLTLADWAKRTDPNGNVPIIAELLSQTNEILEDAVFKEGNLPTGERVVIRTGLPTVYWRALNQGIPNSKSTSAQVDEACGMLEARSEVDKEFGGEKLSENLSTAKKALDQFGTPELRSLLNESGLGNHPEFIRFMFRAGKSISEDRYVGQANGAAPTQGRPRDFASQAAFLYPKQS